MKILHLNRFSYSGQTTHVFSLVQEQQRQGHLSHLALEGYPTLAALNVYRKTIERLGVTVIRPGDKKTLSRMIQKHKYDIIHAHSSLTFPMAHRLCREFGIPYVVTCHGLGLNKEEYKAFFHDAGALFCISPRVEQSMHDYADKVLPVVNGVDLELFKPEIKAEPVKVALVSRIDAWKQEGYHHFCKAADLLEGVEFYIASNKPPLSPRAVFLGWTDDVAELLAKTDIVVGTGRAIVEGLASGNAALVLGRTYQGLVTSEKMKEEDYLDFSGLFGSDPCYKDIFFEMARLARDIPCLRKLQEAGRIRAEQYYDNTTICNHISDAYERILR